ncbi:hypothetical protein GP475_01235 [Corynebacterium poyangense]|uniref:Uncharacterized protein n=1 Tax=Corynebacterium poyangense TaxID=2684405 RepID=A0A7H0SLH8_9CORY|nr:hypothetical protein GP475_01235 [Corynebacterium poyangense]
MLADAIGLPAQFRDAFRAEWCSVVAPVGPEHPERHIYERRLQQLQEFIFDLVTALEDPTQEPGPEHSIVENIVFAASHGVITPEERNSMIFQPTVFASVGWGVETGAATGVVGGVVVCSESSLGSLCSTGSECSLC